MLIIFCIITESLEHLKKAFVQEADDFDMKNG